MFIVILSLLDYFNFGKVSHEHKYYSGKDGVAFRFHRAFVVSSIPSRKIREL